MKYKYTLSKTKLFCFLIIGFIIGSSVFIPNMGGKSEQIYIKPTEEIYEDDKTFPYYYGYLPPPSNIIPDEVGQNGFYPSSWDWRNVEYNGITGDWCTPIRNQGSCGSCWAFSTLGSTESMINIRKGLPSIDIDLSEQYLLSCPPDSGGCDGWSAYSAFNFLLDNGGAIPESCFPYRADDIIPCSDKCDDWINNLIPVKNVKFYGSLNTETIKSKIVNHGPLSACFDVYDDFHDYTEGVYRYQYGDYVAGHCIVIVGYDDSEDCWICKNSWGPAWGENGYFRIGYGECGIQDEIYSIDFDPDAVNLPPVVSCGGLYSGKVNESIQFDSSETFDVENNIESYEWEFGDGIKSSKPNPTHVYSKEGIYPVKLTVIDAEGAKGIEW